MPLRSLDEPAPQSLTSVPETFLIFYSSIVDGQLWCPDCRVVDGLIQETFGNADGPAALIVYAGDKPTWKAPTNVFRGDPWRVDSVPTIIKIREGKEVGRLVDTEIRGGLAEFIKG